MLVAFSRPFGLILESRFCKMEGMGCGGGRVNDGVLLNDVCNIECDPMFLHVLLNMAFLILRPKKTNHMVIRGAPLMNATQPANQLI